MSADVIVFPPQNKLGSCQASTTGDIIKRGQAILDRLDSSLKWDTDWRDLILALGAGRDIALRSAGTDKPQGRKYREVIGPWLRCYGFDRIDEADRSRLIFCFDNLAAINAWRATLPAEKQEKLNHPRFVLAHWKRSLQPAQSEEQNTKPAGPPAPSITADAVIAWLASATQEDKRRVGAALAADVRVMKRILPGKQITHKATHKQILEKALGLMAVDPTEGAPC